MIATRAATAAAAAAAQTSAAAATPTEGSPGASRENAPVVQKAVETPGGEDEEIPDWESEASGNSDAGSESGSGSDGGSQDGSDSESDSGWDSPLEAGSEDEEYVFGQD